MKSTDLIRTALLGLTLAGAPLMLAACDDGPAEETGEAIDEAREEAAEDLEERAEELEERQ